MMLYIKYKRAQRALGRLPEGKVKGHSGAIYRGSLMLSTNIGKNPISGFRGDVV